MSVFTKEKVYTDVLWAWRKIKVGEYQMFDKVLILDVNYTCIHGEYIGQEWIIMSLGNDDTEYIVLMNDGKSLWAKPEYIKKSYWEFQEEFEALEAAKQAYNDIEILSKQLAERQIEAERLYKKGKKVVEQNISNSFWII